MEKLRVGIIGAASYVSGKLIELLLDHGQVDITYLASDHFPNQSIEEAHSHLKDILSLKFERYDFESVAERCDIVFISKHHGVAVKQTPPLLEKGIKVIDLSADFRLKNPKDFKEWYGLDHDAPMALQEAVYGLPELNFEKIQEAKLIANPGCYPTSVILGAAPLFNLALVDTKEIIIVDSVSGISGAGKSNGDFKNQFINMSDNLRPYDVGTHRHTPEMEQELSALSHDGDVKILFAPHVGPFKYGIKTNIYVTLKDDTVTEEQIIEEYKSFYQDKPYIRIYEVNKIPEIKDVVGTNFCDIGIRYDKRSNRCIIFSVLDNIIKGAAGQAIQNMNIMFRFDAKEGLPYKHALNKKNDAMSKDKFRLLKNLSM